MSRQRGTERSGLKQRMGYKIIITTECLPHATHTLSPPAGGEYAPWPQTYEGQGMTLKGFLLNNF